MFGLFDSIADLATNVVKVAAAPIEVAVDLTNAVVKPMADAAEVVVQDVKSIKD